LEELRVAFFDNFIKKSQLFLEIAGVLLFLEIFCLGAGF